MSSEEKCYCCNANEEAHYLFLYEFNLPIRRASFNTYMDKKYKVCLNCIVEISNNSFEFMQQLRERNGIYKEVNE